MPHFLDLTFEQQLNYGNGCGLRRVPVPSFCFLASCRHHDFNFERGSDTWYKAPYYYCKANWDFYTHMLTDSYRWHHYPLATIYFLTVMVVSWPFFTVGRWRTIEEILEADLLSKRRMV